VSTSHLKQSTFRNGQQASKRSNHPIINKPCDTGHALQRWLSSVAWLSVSDFDIFLMHKSSTNTTGWFLLRSFDDLCAKPFLMLAILLYNFETLTLAYFR